MGDGSLPGLRRISVRGRSIGYRRAGRGSPLVLLHGFGADSRLWRPQLTALAAWFDVIAWDAPGAGSSVELPAGHTIADWADDLAAFLAGLEIDRANVVGISWGGLLAQELYRRHEALVRMLVLADTYAGWRGSLGESAAEQRLAAALHAADLGPDGFVDAMLPSMFGSMASAEDRAELTGIMRSFRPDGFRRMATVLAGMDSRDLLPAIGVPTLLIWGDEDSRSPVAVGRALHEAIKDSSLVVIPGAGHVSNLEAHDVFNRHVCDFLLGAG